MIKLTKAKARELVKRELGVHISRLLELDPIMPYNPQYPWYHVKIGDLGITVYTLEDGRVTQLLLKYGFGSITTHFFTDTLEIFYKYSEMQESQDIDDRDGEISKRTKEYEYEVRETLRKHYIKPAKPIRRCRVCDCTDSNACFGGCYWVETNLCSQCANREDCNAD